MRRPAAPNPRSGLMLGLLLIHPALAAPSQAQWASSSQVSVRSLNATYANGSGFSLATNGEVNYSGPLNTAAAGVVPPSLVLRLNGDTVFEGDLPGVADALPERAIYPRLSPRLREATLAVGGDPGSDGQTVLKSGIGETLPLFVDVGASLVELSLESVDGQSFSVYPRFSPSLELPRESGLYSDPNNPDNPNAANAGPTVLDASSLDTF